jgi:hypothetical protein
MFKSNTILWVQFTFVFYVLLLSNRFGKYLCTQCLKRIANYRSRFFCSNCDGNFCQLCHLDHVHHQLEEINPSYSL